MPHVPRKILHLMPRFAVGGAESLVLEYYRQFDPERFTIYVGSTVEDGELRQRFPDESRVYVGSRQKQGGRLGAWRELKKYVDTLQPDIIHTHLESADWFGFLLKRRYGNRVRWISTQHNVEFHTAWYRRLISRLTLRSADAVIAVSPAVAEYCRRYFDIPDSQLTTIPNGINLAPWLAVSTSKLCAHVPVEIASVGRLEVQKGHVFLLRALQKVADMPWHVTVYGSGSERFHLEQLAKKFGIAQRITWAGTVFNLPERMAKTDIVVQPSLWEGLSLTVMQAMASARPVVASAAAGEGLLEDNKTGWIVPTGNSDLLATTLAMVLKNLPRAKAYGLAARAHAESHFSIQPHIERLAAVYDKL